MIQVRVKLFAIYQDTVGQEELMLDLPDGSAVEVVRDRLIQDYPVLQQWRDITRFGRNLEFVEPGTVLHNGDEVVLIPPVSGG